MNRSMSWMLGFLVAPAAALAQGSGTGGEPNDPVEILKKVDAAAKAIKSVDYDITFEGTGAAKALAGSMKLSYKGTDRTTNIPKRYLCRAEIKMPGSDEVIRIEAGSDGEKYFLIDHKTKMVHEDIDPNVVGRMGDRLLRGLMLEYLHPTPFSDEINAKSHELKGSKTIEGEDCWEIHVSYALADQQATWWFSKKDFLPRARRDYFKIPTGEEAGGMKTVTRLVVDPKMGDEAFKAQVPEGYTKTDEFPK